MTSPLSDLFEQQRIENARLSGQIVALEMAVKLLFMQHPNPNALAGFYSKAIDGLLDITLATRMPEEMRDALDQARNGLLEALARRMTRDGREATTSPDVRTQRLTCATSICGGATAPARPASGAPAGGRAPRVDAIAPGSAPGSATVASSIQQTPWRHASCCACRKACASRVLPTPPAPTSVTSRCASTSAASAARSPPRPISGAGRASATGAAAARAVAASSAACRCAVKR
ncbi:MAG: hypothetical protein JF586_08305 [Burkholderiales bacterium]|nr:hypothetical protein [Burkholderiales bacterium]